MNKPKVLVIGSEGQLGAELTLALINRYGVEQVIASDIEDRVPKACKFLQLNVLDLYELEKVVESNGITVIYHLAAMLSATGEKLPKRAWELNMDGLLNVLYTAVRFGVKQIYWPSSIAVFGRTTPRVATPQSTLLEPNTVYGISKLAGELWCNYFWEKHGLDIRSIRYPGLISYKAAPGGGTTDYAVEIFFKAVSEGKYTSFLAPDTALPMMFIDDAVQATIQLMEAPASQISIRTSYNLGGMSFTPSQLADAIKKRLPDFQMQYQPDSRQLIADSWPDSIDDAVARKDWGFRLDYDFEKMVDTMLEHVPK